MVTLAIRQRTAGPGCDVSSAGVGGLRRELWNVLGTGNRAFRAELKKAKKRL